MKKINLNNSLYRSKFEKDSCGIGFVANINNIQSREIVDYGLEILCNLTHRGAVSADPKAGDGVGILTQIPHQFFKKELKKHNVVLPKPMEYAIGVFFLPNQESKKKQCLKQIDKILKNDIDVIIFDLGLSSIQLNNLKRGFSFKSKDTLDMRMGLSDVSLKDAINNLSQEQLKLIIKILGEEEEASIISKNIIKARSEKKITLYI